MIMTILNAITTSSTMILLSLSLSIYIDCILINNITFLDYVKFYNQIKKKVAKERN